MLEVFFYKYWILFISFLELWRARSCSKHFECIRSCNPYNWFILTPPLYRCGNWRHMDAKSSAKSDSPNRCQSQSLGRAVWAQSPAVKQCCCWQSVTVGTLTEEAVFVSPVPAQCLACNSSGKVLVGWFTTREHFRVKREGILTYEKGVNDTSTFLAIYKLWMPVNTSEHSFYFVRRNVMNGWWEGAGVWELGRLVGSDVSLMISPKS